MSWRSQRKNLPDDFVFTQEYQCIPPPQRDFKNLNDPNLAPGDWILLDFRRARSHILPRECQVLQVDGDRVTVEEHGWKVRRQTFKRSNWSWDEKTQMNV